MLTGDMMDDERILNWLTSQDVFELRNEIEEVNRKMLDKLLDENEFLAVFFCTSQYLLSYIHTLSTHSLANIIFFIVL